MIVAGQYCEEILQYIYIKLCRTRGTNKITITITVIITITARKAQDFDVATDKVKRF